MNDPIEAELIEAERCAKDHFPNLYPARVAQFLDAREKLRALKDAQLVARAFMERGPPGVTVRMVNATGLIKRALLVEVQSGSYRDFFGYSDDLPFLTDAARKALGEEA